MPTIHNNAASIYLGDDFNDDPEFADDPGALFALRLHSGNGHLLVRPPAFLLNGARVVVRPDDFAAAGPPENVFGDVWEHRLSGRLTDTAATLEVVLRVAKTSPVVRFRYALRPDAPARLTKPNDGRDDLVYLSASLADFPDAAEVRFSEFSDLFHSFVPSERPLAERHFEAGVTNVFGPLLVATNERDSGGPSALLAYEHGSQVPDAFLGYDLSAPGRVVTLRAVKGNYCDGQIVGPDAPFETPWFQMALVDWDTDR